MVYFFASQPVDEDRCVGYVTIGRNYDREQPDSGAAGLRGHDLRAGPARGRVPAAGARAVRPRGRDAPEVRRGRDQLPQGDARAGPGEAPDEPRRRDRAAPACAARPSAGSARRSSTARSRPGRSTPRPRWRPGWACRSRRCARRCSSSRNRGMVDPGPQPRLPGRRAHRRRSRRRARAAGAASRCRCSGGSRGAGRRDAEHFARLVDAGHRTPPRRRHAARSWTSTARFHLGLLARAGNPRVVDVVDACSITSGSPPFTSRLRSPTSPRPRADPRRDAAGDRGGRRSRGARAPRAHPHGLA